jgi:hypothetical protein
MEKPRIGHEGTVAVFPFASVLLVVSEKRPGGAAEDGGRREREPKKGHIG